MKIKDGFMLRNVAGNNIVVAVGRATLDFSGMITLNDSATFIWTMLKDGVDIQEITDKVCENFEIDRKTAEKDIKSFVEELKGAGVVE